MPLIEVKSSQKSFLHRFMRLRVFLVIEPFKFEFKFWQGGGTAKVTLSQRFGWVRLGFPMLRV